MHVLHSVLLLGPCGQVPWGAVWAGTHLCLLPPPPLHGGMEGGGGDEEGKAGPAPGPSEWVPYLAERAH